jgi:uncharacterized protein YjbI with pentapeptide repeats
MAVAQGQNLSLPDIVASVNDAAATARNVTTAMLGTAVTLAATILASTDEAILRDQLSAPFGISASISLHVAYALMPVVFLFLHVNGLLQLHVLTERIELFEKMLPDHVTNEKERDRWRRRLHGFAFVQYFTDDEHIDSNVNRLLEYIRNSLLWTVNQVSISWVPLLILIGTEVSFLRYQSPPITTLHQTVIVLDIGFVVWFQIAQSRYLRRPAERPTPWLFGFLLLFGFFWLVGLDPLIAVPTLLGWVFGKAVIVTSRFLGRQPLWWSLCIAAGVLLGVVIGVAPNYLLGWLAGLALANTRRAVSSSITLLKRGLRWFASTRLGIAIILILFIPLALLLVILWVLYRALVYVLPSNMMASRIKAHRTAERPEIKVSRWLKYAVVYGTMPAIFIWFTVSQARIASPDEAACEVRWNWDSATTFSEAQAGDQELEPEDDQLADRLDYASRISTWNKQREIASRSRWYLSVDQILRPLVMKSHVHCLTDNGPQLPVAIRFSEDEPPTASKHRANLLDRLFCARWSMGCRYLTLSSLILMGRDSPQSAFDDFGLSPEDVALVRQRALGLQAKERSLRFARLDDATLLGADLRETDLRGADLNRARLQGAQLYKADLTSATLESADLQTAVLGEAKLHFVKARKANFKESSDFGIQAIGADFSEADFSGAKVGRGSFIGADFSNAQMKGSNFSRSNLSRANLSNADLTGALLISSNLQNVLFSYPKMQDYWVFAASMNGAVLIGANLSDAVGHIACFGAFQFPVPAGAPPAADDQATAGEIDALLASKPEAALSLQQLPQRRHANHRHDLKCISGDLLAPVSAELFAVQSQKLACADKVAANAMLGWYTSPKVVNTFRGAPEADVSVQDPGAYVGVITVRILYRASQREDCPGLKKLSDQQAADLNSAYAATEAWHARFIAHEEAKQGQK